MSDRIGVAVIGGGPAGLAAALSASREGASVLLIEREARLGGILKQCIHDGFGVIRFGEKLSGPEYACRDIRELEQTDTIVMLQTFVTRIEKKDEGFLLTLVNRNGMAQVEAKSLVLATYRRKQACGGYNGRLGAKFCKFARQNAHKKMCNFRQRRHRFNNGAQAYP
jgi:thioredoxin reductase